MIVCLMTAAANLVVGGLVGLCGVAGFLLPMFYTAGLGINFYRRFYFFYFYQYI